MPIENSENNEKLPEINTEFHEKHEEGEKIFSKEELLFIKQHTLPDIYDANGNLDINRSPSFIHNEADKQLTKTVRERGFLKKGKFSYLGPGTIHSLFTHFEGNQKKTNESVIVDIGEGSNIQEIHEIDINPNQKLKIKLGNNSSMAHGVEIKIGNSTPETVKINIGDNTFVGINTKLIGNVDIGNNVAVGFNVSIKDNVKIGNNVIVGDGTMLNEEIELPDNCVVLGGTSVTKESLKNMYTVKEFLNIQDKKREHGVSSCEGIIMLDPKNAQKELRELGNMYDFLQSFNEKVTAENLTFPVLNKLLSKYHRIENTKESKIKHKNLGHVEIISVQYPRNIHAFLEHYFHEAQKKEKDKNYEIQIYDGEFTNVNVDHETKFNGGTVRFYGETTIEESEIGRSVIFRGDESGTFEVRDSYIGHKTVFHANGHKKVENSRIGGKNVIHGKANLKNVNSKEKVLVHNVTAKNASIGKKSSIVEATLENTEIGDLCGITGHGDNGKNGNTKRQGVFMKNVSLGENVHIRFQTEIEGFSEKNEQGIDENVAPLFINKNTRIGHSVSIKGAKEGTIIGENVGIGNQTTIHGCKKIGNKTIIGNNVTLKNIAEIPSHLFIPDNIECNNEEEFNKAIREGQMNWDISFEEIQKNQDIRKKVFEILCKAETGVNS